MYAHSLPGAPMEAWEPLSAHLSEVAALAAEFAAPFGWSGAARVAGQLHDIGKVSKAYQAYIAIPRNEGKGAKGPDHSTAGARAAIAAFGPKFGRILAYAIAGHHAGLGNGDELDRRLGPGHRIEPFEGWEAQTGPLPPAAALRPPPDFKPLPPDGFSTAFLTRMLFSCLVDADFLATEAFYQGQMRSGGHTALETLRDRLRAYMAGLKPGASAAVNAARARVLEHAVAQAAMPPGLFTLTVPTGGGKTLASLSFALEHAVRHGLRRVVYVIPFTSIVEQTATVFRTALSSEADVLEHHASFDWPEDRRDGGGEAGSDGLVKLRQAAENWDVPVVVTTAVQFFESLFANRPGRCRKLHNLAGAVIVLDEAQTLPLPLLRPCMAALEELARNYRSSVVLCTATQPALRQKDGFKGGFAIDESRELAPDPQGLYAALKRVQVEMRPGPVADAEIAERFAAQPQMLCIVNSRAHARALFEAVRHLPGAVHLSTLMVPRHRRQVLEAVRRRLAAAEPVRLVSTSLIEAGVDISLPEVWRAAAGLDSIAQAAGRCNRHGERPMGRVVVFEPAKNKPPCAVAACWQATRPVLRAQEDLLGLDAVRAYFRELYWQKGAEALDALEVDGPRGVMPALAARSDDLRFPFRSLAEVFRLIDEIMEPVVVPWDGEAEQLLREISAAERPMGTHLRRLQPYTVSIPRAARRDWLARGVLRAVHPALGEGLLRFNDLAHYRPETGVDLDTPEMRAAESNLF